MSSPNFSRDQTFTDPLALSTGHVRDSMSAGEIQAAGARRLLETGQYTRAQRQRLHDLSRVSRIAAGDRSGLATILDLAPLASPASALYLAELVRAEIIGRSSFAIPTPGEANDDEEAANHVCNIAQLRHGARRSRSSLDELIEAATVQVFASQVLAASEARWMPRRAISIASR